MEDDVIVHVLSILVTDEPHETGLVVDNEQDGVTLPTCVVPIYPLDLYAATG